MKLRDSYSHTEVWEKRNRSRSPGCTGNQSDSLSGTPFRGVLSNDCIEKGWALLTQLTTVLFCFLLCFILQGKDGKMRDIFL